MTRHGGTPYKIATFVAKYSIAAKLYHWGGSEKWKVRSEKVKSED
jgi:hypothetical protein